MVWYPASKRSSPAFRSDYVYCITLSTVTFAATSINTNLCKPILFSFVYTLICRTVIPTLTNTSSKLPRHTNHNVDWSWVFQRRHLEPSRPIFCSRCVVPQTLHTTLYAKSKQNTEADSFRNRLQRREPSSSLHPSYCQCKLCRLGSTDQLQQLRQPCSLPSSC